MRVCIPSQGEAGLEDRLHPHFGSAPFFTLVDLATDEVSTVPNLKDDEDHGQCRALDRVGGLDVDCMIVGGMGQRAVMALNQARIRVYQADPAPVHTLIIAIRSGKLPPLDVESACAGHAQGHGGCAH